jgi:ABA DEFICIENT 4-like
MERPMNPDVLFSLANAVAAAAWLVLAVAPARWALARLAAGAAALALAVLYAGLIAAFWAGGEGDFGSLAGVASLFEQRGLLLAGWVHYLVFDLLIGLWEREEAARIGLSRWLLLPCLFLTFMFGPLGWLLFLALRTYRQRGQRAGAAMAA